MANTPPTAHVKFTLHQGEPETGVWCDSCKLSSAVRFPIYLLSERFVHLLGHVVICASCRTQTREGYDHVKRD